MKSNRLTIINISWEKIVFDFDILKKYNTESDYGLYQIYGDHMAYGKDKLLYIGKAQDQTFSTRLDKRWEFVESSVKPTSIRLGRIVQSNEEDEPLGWDAQNWGKFIDISERILIKAHAPALNKQENAGLFSNEFIEEKGNYLILNWGSYGSILPEVSTFRHSYRFWNFDKPLV